jgi:hypothetical protein
MKQAFIHQVSMVNQYVIMIDEIYGKGFNQKESAHIFFIFPFIPNNPFVYVMQIMTKKIKIQLFYGFCRFLIIIIHYFT